MSRTLCFAVASVRVYIRARLILPDYSIAAVPIAGHNSFAQVDRDSIELARSHLVP